MRTAIKHRIRGGRCSRTSLAPGEIRSCRPCSVERPATARRLATPCLGGWGIEPELGDWVRVVVSEFVGNVTFHGGTGAACFGIALRSHEVVVLVINEGPVARVIPEDSFGDAIRESGRGLLIVAALSTRVGIRRHGDMNLVLARLRLTHATALGAAPRLTSVALACAAGAVD
ncbi:ATP-binding protein [Embleya sp. NPDC020886]|uniref:ATP-binding protein n=1 Tax=Embleya sp. NPDC020886 TaxID=3363980 RepID=UPI0037B1B8A8